MGYIASINRLYNIIQMEATLCIPRIESSTQLEYVRAIFNKMNMGIINRISEIPLRVDASYKRVMIQMTIDMRNDKGSYIVSRFRSGQNVKIVHNGPEYWKVVMGRVNAVDSPDRSAKVF